MTDWGTNTEIKLDVTVTNGTVAWSTKSINTFVTENSQVNTDEGGEAEEKFDYAGYLGWVWEWTLTDRWETEDDSNGGSSGGSGNNDDPSNDTDPSTNNGNTGNNTNPSTDNSNTSNDVDENNGGQNKGKDQEDLSTGAIIGIVLAVVLLAVICTVLGFIVGYTIVSKKKQNEEK